MTGVDSLSKNKDEGGTDWCLSTFVFVSFWLHIGFGGFILPLGPLKCGDAYGFLSLSMLGMESSVKLFRDMGLLEELRWPDWLWRIFLMMSSWEGDLIRELWQCLP